MKHSRSSLPVRPSSAEVEELKSCENVLLFLAIGWHPLVDSHDDLAVSPCFHGPRPPTSHDRRSRPPTTCATTTRPILAAETPKRCGSTTSAAPMEGSQQKFGSCIGPNQACETQALANNLIRLTRKSRAKSPRIRCDFCAHARSCICDSCQIMSYPTYLAQLEVEHRQNLQQVGCGRGEVGEWCRGKVITNRQHVVQVRASKLVHV